MWIKTENSDNTMPLAVEECGNIIIVRKNFQLVDATDERPAHYEYEEAQMARERYEVYKLTEELEAAKIILGVE